MEETVFIQGRFCTGSVKQGLKDMWKGVSCEELGTTILLVVCIKCSCSHTMGTADLPGTRFNLRVFRVLAEPCVFDLIYRTLLTLSSMFDVFEGDLLM